MEFKLVDVNKLHKFKDILLNIINNKQSELRGLLSSSVSSTNKCPSTTEVNNSITNAINGLDVASAGGAGKFIKAISQTDGKISATEGTLSMTLSGNDLYITFA